MKLSLRSPGFLLLSLVLGACGGDGLTPTIGPSGLTITATLSAVSLAYDCGAQAGASSGFAPCAPGDICQPLCQQSNLQLDLSASDGTGSAPVEVVRVRIFASGEQTAIDELSARAPRQWIAGSGYVAWDQVLAPLAQVKASYELTAPDWATIEGGGARLSGPQSTYRVEVELRIDGQLRTLSLDGVTREPEVAT